MRHSGSIALGLSPLVAIRAGSITDDAADSPLVDHRRSKKPLFGDIGVAYIWWH